WAGRMVVRQRMTNQFRVKALQTMQSVAVQKPAGVGRGIELDSLDAEKITRGVYELRSAIELGKDEAICHDQDRHHQSKSENSTAKQVGNQNDRSVDGYRRLEICSDVYTRPLQQLGGANHQEPKSRRNNQISTVDLGIGISRLAEESYHCYQQG